MKLTQVAATMRQNLDLARQVHKPDAYITRELPHGLVIIRGYTASGREYLVIRRENVYPSPTELQLVATAFGLDLDTFIPDQYRRSERHAVSGRQITWCCLRLQWCETPARSGAGLATQFVPCEA